MKRSLTILTVGFVIICGVMVFQTGLFDCSQREDCILLPLASESAGQDAKPAIDEQELIAVEAGEFEDLGAANAKPKVLTLGSLDPNSAYKFEIKLTSKGAAIKSATFNQFDDRDYKNPQPLTILNPVKKYDGSQILSLANQPLVFPNQDLRLPLDKLEWQSEAVSKAEDGTQTASFTAMINDGGKDVLKLTKTYTIKPDTYLIECGFTAENLWASDLDIISGLTGPVGMNREDTRTDMRKVITAYMGDSGKIKSHKFTAKDVKVSGKIENKLRDITRSGLWMAEVNKYFAAIVRPVPAEGQAMVKGVIYTLDKYSENDKEISRFNLALPDKLTAAGTERSKNSYKFQVYLGPKDKKLFVDNPLYKQLGFVHSVELLACCCPAAVINPLSFGILAVMEFMYHDLWIGNYGIVIIIMVFLIRLLMHPITKKSQVSMSKFSKIASSPALQDIKNRNEGNNAEIQRQTMAFYKEQGVSPVPIAGMLPMFIQMPIWIALYSAIYASISLRGAAFLPVWITDLSAPDALIRFATVTVPILGWQFDSLNFLPLLMGVAMFLQQKLMPHQSAASTNPQAQQQQKMMMFMMPLMFPLFLYKAPSGLNLYIMASTFAGVIEQVIIRKHIREKEEADDVITVRATSKTGGKAKKKKPKPFFKDVH